LHNLTVVKRMWINSKKRSHLNILLMLTVIITGCLPASAANNDSAAISLRQQISRAAQPYALDIATWEIGNLVRPLDDGLAPVAIDGAELRGQISQVIQENNLAVLPPVHFRIDRPPCLLVVSPRDRIAYFDRILLDPDLSETEVQTIEKQVNSLNLSSLVVELGGLGAAYPAIVSPELRTKQLIDAAVEEWAHQYLAFRPLGFLYLLDSIGIRQDPDVITMNETLAGMIADEISSQVYQRYYGSGAATATPADNKSFDFAFEMRETRRKVDFLLDEGNVDEAESYMEGRRRLFTEKGYRIRKLNQAYFAFHGIYGQDPGSVSPIYEALKELRSNYKSLAEFVASVSAMTGYKDLKLALHRDSN